MLAICRVNVHQARSQGQLARETRADIGPARLPRFDLERGTTKISMPEGFLTLADPLIFNRRSDESSRDRENETPNDEPGDPADRLSLSGWGRSGAKALRHDAAADPKMAAKGRA